MKTDLIGTRKHRVVSIEITRAEGPTTECGHTHVVSTFEAARKILRDMSETAPATGGYDKCDFLVMWDDGETYEGRYDLKHHSCEDEPLDIAQHISDVLGFYSGRVKPAHMTEERYRDYLRLTRQRSPGISEQSARFLDTYQLTD
jgi:hypothetical protein